MKSVNLTAHPDPAVWVLVPNGYPDRRGTDPLGWARSVAEDYGPTDAEGRERFTLLMQDVAESERGRDEGDAYLFLPEDLGAMAKARLLFVPTAAVGEDAAHGPLDPATETFDAQYLGRGTRTVSAGRAHPANEDLLVTVTYRWDVADLTVLLVLTTLDPAQAVTMLDELDEFADNLWLEDSDGELVGSWDHAEA
ncbi:hypothetical protein [Georgenia subflava]|uniref:Uncharacterized protein n=1 Tax=Georgenia subflava TaxID=1622177 RepID=A0A6N7EM09_9MICO|nr:hypothetical protein [Georgenia subflava]MPV37176.1 hypothetical protein [Georgenia subflava]